MALIECPRCERKVSEQAEECPSCGYLLPPVADMLRRIKPLKTQIGTTPKKVWDFLRFLGIVTMIVGVISFISVNELAYSPSVVLVGIGIFLFARIGTWLKHG